MDGDVRAVALGASRRADATGDLRDGEIGDTGKARMTPWR
jgi:hypothetical protein